MPTAGIRVLLIGPPFELPYDVRHVQDPTKLLEIIATFRPDVIVTSTTGFVPGVLQTASYELRKRWIHVDGNASAEAIGRAIEFCYKTNLWDAPQLQALVSVYTPTFNTGDYLRDTYQSLREQTRTTWEWVVVDDGSTDGTWERLLEYAKEDWRVHPHRLGMHSGKIGELKGIGCKLARGQYLVELDHDDMLTETALEEVAKAFDENPNVGMVYTNYAAFFENGDPHKFSEEDPAWKGRYKETEYHGKKYLECDTPDIYDRFGDEHWQQYGWYLTVGPHHIRAYRASLLREYGGYNHELPVADDWDVFARFFLRSSCLKIPKMLYLYRVRDAWVNTTFIRNKSIQDHLALARDRYLQEFQAFNRKRLEADGKIAPAQPQVTPEKKYTACGYGCGGGWYSGTVPRPWSDEARHWCTNMLSYIVLDGGGTEMTVDCLRSIRKHSPGSEIVLIGNGVESKAKDLAYKYVQLEGNIRFGAGNNLGARHATRPFLCFFNDDAELVDDQTPLRLLEVARAGQIAGPFASRAKPPQGNYASLEDAPPDSLINVEMVAGLCLAIARSKFDAIGGFDHQYRVWWDDDDLCHRFRKVGWPCRIVGKTWVKHKEHATFTMLGLDVQRTKDMDKARFDMRSAPLKVAAICRDEITALPGFVDQWAPVAKGTDIVLMDTGSADDTVALAKQRGARVVASSRIIEEEGFAHARNAIAEIADSEWIIMTDIDERISKHTIKAIPDLIASAGDRFDAFLCPLDAVYPDGSRKAFVPKVFLYRQSAMHWECLVHEKLVGPRQALVMNALNEHMIGLHTAERRTGAETLYQSLAAREPYFTDPAHRTAMRAEWPILDYDMHDDPRLTKVYAGPLVTAVIATYKRPELCARAIESALAQDWLNLQVVVVGDACPRFAELEKTYGFHPRVRLINLTKNTGGVGQIPRNIGIQAAAGEYIAYLDDDNRWEPNHVSSIMEAVRLERWQATWGMSSMKVDGVDCKFIRPKFQGIDTSCVLHHKDLFWTHGPWKHEEGYAADWGLFSRWLNANEPWVATALPTVDYNAETSGQAGFIRQIAKAAQSKQELVIPG